MTTAGLKSDSGNVIVEFVGIAIGMLIPVIFVATGCWNIAQAHLALRDAAVSSARGFVLSSTESQGYGRMNSIVNDIVADYGISPQNVVRTATCSTSNCVARGTLVTVRVRYNVKFSIPIFGNYSIPISDTHTEQVDEVQ